MGQQQLQGRVLHRWISSQYCMNSLHTSTYSCYVCCSYNNHMYTTVPYITTVYYSLRVRHSNRLSVSKSTDKAFHTLLQNRNTNVYFGFCLSRNLSEVHQQGASGQRATQGAIGQHAEPQLCSCGRQAQDCSVNSGSHFDLRLLD